MKSRDLHTTAVVIVTDYEVHPGPGGKFIHSFHPESTSTEYYFIANRERILEEGQCYNFAYVVEGAKKKVDVSSIAKAADVDPQESYREARVHGEKRRSIEEAKSNSRVVHNKQGKYLGKKYAWRIYGMSIPNSAFYKYIESCGHATTPCTTDGSPSVAYLEAGLEKRMKDLIDSAVRVRGNRFRSPLLPGQKSFTIKGVDAVTDKK